MPLRSVQASIRVVVIRGQDIIILVIHSRIEIFTRMVFIKIVCGTFPYFLQLATWMQYSRGNLQSGPDPFLSIRPKRNLPLPPRVSLTGVNFPGKCPELRILILNRS